MANFIDYIGGEIFDLKSLLHTLLICKGFIYTFIACLSVQ